MDRARKDNDDIYHKKKMLSRSCFDSQISLFNSKTKQHGIKQDQKRTDTHMHTRSICGERDIEWWEKRKIKDTTRNISS